jgi:hypothetical protein
VSAVAFQEAPAGIGNYATYCPSCAEVSDAAKRAIATVSFMMRVFLMEVLQETVVLCNKSDCLPRLLSRVIASEW